jgi:hypothetical protein
MQWPLELKWEGNTVLKAQHTFYGVSGDLVFLSVTKWLRNYATSWKVALSRPDEVKDFYKFI